MKIFFVFKFFYVHLQSQKKFHNDKENIPAVEQKKKEQTRFPGENGDCQRS